MVPSIYTSVKGYAWNKSPGAGCIFMELKPVDKKGESAIGLGYPILLAKLAPGGRIIKAAIACAPVLTLDFTHECLSWDSTLDPKTFTSRRDFSDPMWPGKVDLSADTADSSNPN